jgi:hypothetical protein
MFDLEDDTLGRDLSDATTRDAMRARILQIIREYRAP